MKFDIVFAGVGGQGVLSVAAAIASAALDQDGSPLHVLQAEVHGMSQRGGAVTASLRISDKPVHSPLVSHGTADLLISMEPLETLRYLPLLAQDARVITAIAPVRNIPDYPSLDELLAHLRTLPRTHLIDTDRLARDAGSTRASNMVLVGAASSLLPLPPQAIEKAIRKIFDRKGEKVVETNLKALALGRQAAAL